MRIKYFLAKYILKPKIKNKGQNNKIEIAKSAYLRKVRFEIFGDNNEILIGDNVYLHNAKIAIGFSNCPINNCKIHLNNWVSCNSLAIQLGESESEVLIGNNTIISFNVEISCTDTHSICDMENRLINRGKKVEIGDNVWICKNVTILKNTKIADNSIVALGSIVTKQFEQKNVILAGNPAKIVKENIKWDLRRPEQYKEV